jgi:hypothetical protein
MADSFLSGLARGFSGESVSSMAANVRENQSLNDRNLINSLRREGIVNNTIDGVQVDWEKFNLPEYKNLRKRTLKSGGKALFRYYGRDGSIKQGAFDDAIEVDGGYAVGTEKEDGSKGQLTEEAGEGENEKVAITPKSHFERTGTQVIRNIYERAFPGLGAAEELKRNQAARIDRETSNTLQNDPRFVEQRNKISGIQDTIKALEAELAKTLEEEDSEPIETRDKVITLNEEIDSLQEEEQALNQELNDLEIPFGIPARLLGEETATDLFELPKASLNYMERLGMSPDQIEGQVKRHNSLLQRAEAAEFEGLFASSDKAKIVVGSQNIVSAEAMKNKILTEPKYDRARQLQQRAENGETLNKQEQAAVTRYEDAINRSNQKIAKNQAAIDEIFTKQAEGDVTKLGNLLQGAKNFFSELSSQYTQGNQAQREYTNKERTHSHKLNKILETNIEESTENPLIGQLRALNVQLLAEEGNYKTMEDLLRSKQYEKKSAIIDLFIAEEYQKSRGAGLMGGVDMLTALENARVSGSYQIGPKELAAAEAERLEKVAALQTEIDKYEKDSIALTQGISTKVGELIKSVRDEATGEFKSSTNPEFVGKSNEIAMEWRAMQENRLRGGTQSNTAYGTAVNNAMKQVIGYSAAAYLEESQPKFWDILPGGRPGVSEFGRWWQAQDFYFAGGVIPLVRQNPTSINEANIGGLVDRMQGRFNSKGDLIALQFKGPYEGDSSVELKAPAVKAMYGDLYDDAVDFFRQRAQNKGSE